MTETVTEIKHVSLGELRWNLISLIFLLMAAIGIIYGWSYKGMGEEILVPSFAALILACFSELQVIEKRLK